MKTEEQFVDDLTRRNKHLTELYEAAWYFLRDPFFGWNSSEVVQRAGRLMDTPHAFLGLIDMG
jgi:hypothetical protein